MSNEPLAGKYRRDLGRLGASLLVVNGAIGAGIFGMPEVLHEAVGKFAPWLVLAAATMIASVVYCFALLTSLTDRSGGPQRFVTDAFGRFPGFQVGWLFYFSRMVVQAANVIVLIAYAASFWPALGNWFHRTSAIFLILGVITAVNVIGIRRAVAVLAVITALKLVPLLLVIGVVVAANPLLGIVALPEFSAIESVALAALYAFVGFENVTTTAGEAKDPKRAMPRALLAGLVVIALIYFGLQYAYSSSPVAGGGSDAPLASLAGYYGGNAGSLLIAAAAVASVLGNALAGHTTASRMTASLADDLLIPGWFGRVSRWGTPANSIVFFGLGALVFALTGSFVTLAVAATLARLIVYMASITALPRLRSAAGLPALTLASSAVLCIAFALCLWATIQSSSRQWLLIAAFLSGGTILFAFAQWSQHFGLAKDRTQ